MTEHPGATLLDPDDATGLRLRWVATRGELDAVEQQNIALGQGWALAKRWDASTLTVEQVRALHAHMFGDVWEWAGRWRQRQTNLGIPPAQIAVSVENLVRDLHTQTAGDVSDEILVTFHHRLVAVHPFANGNGRHARLLADLLAIGAGHDRFSWGRGLGPDARATYLQTLRLADAGDPDSLVTFARS